MSRILVIESSARQQGSVSRQLTADFIAQWQAAHPQDEVTVRDLAKQPVPHLDETLLASQLLAFCEGMLSRFVRSEFKYRPTDDFDARWPLVAAQLQ